MRKTKIVCTLGPASETKEVIIGLCKAGMNVARLNFSHNTHADHQRRIDLVKEVRSELGLPIAIMLDTKGPEYRIKTFERGDVDLHDGEKFVFTTTDVVGNGEKVSVNYEGLPRELSEGDTILLNNGLLSFKVERIECNDIECKVICGGHLSDRKSMSFPGKVMSQPYLSEQDKSDIKFGVENGVDYIACSFVSRSQDLIDVRNYLKELNAENIELIAKIENQSGVDNIEDICKYCDGIMIARGDMGVEVPFEFLPAIQKKLITKCRLLGKRVITATEMLESMITNARPTRAEISDVANAVYDGTSAIMLSGETAAGKFPVQAVEAMAKIALQTEKNLTNKYNRCVAMSNTGDALSHSACVLAEDIGAKAIVVCSRTGGTVRKVSKYRPKIDIIGMVIEPQSYRKLALSWGVIPVLSEEFDSMDVLFYHAKRAAVKTGLVKKGDKIIITGGNPNGKSGNSSVINIVEI